ncbi:MAG: DUF4307 domain-containing protein [Nocardioides sp.]|nr:DUF4307 domain-containing protein [Nocardioides sp.]
MTSQTPPALPVDRYGAPRPGRRRALVAGCLVVIVVFLGWLAWTTWVHANPLVDSELVSFDVVDEHTTTAVVQIDFANDDVEASCTLRAIAEDHTSVGDLSFTPDPRDGSRFELTIRTERRATSVESLGCLAEGQSRRR